MEKSNVYELSRTVCVCAKTAFLRAFHAKWGLSLGSKTKWLGSISREVVIEQQSIIIGVPLLQSTCLAVIMQSLALMHEISPFFSCRLTSQFWQLLNFQPQMWRWTLMESRGEEEEMENRRWCINSNSKWTSHYLWTKDSTHKKSLSFEIR